MFDCSQSSDFLALAVRVLAFCAVFGVLPRVFVPLSARLAFGVSILVFVAPLRGLSFCFDARFALSWSQLVLELGAGFALGVLLSLAAYCAMLLGQWASALVFAGFESSEDREAYQSEDFRKRSTLSVVFMLLFLLVFFDRKVLDVYQFFGQSLAWEAQTLLSKELLFFVVRSVFEVAILLVLPLFVAVVVVDILFIVMNRYLARVVRTSLVAATKIPFVVMLISLSLYAVVDQLSVAIDRSTSSDAREVLGGR